MTENAIYGRCAICNGTLTAGHICWPPTGVYQSWNVPQVTSVRIPTSADEAAAMVLIGTEYLKQHAPERLRATVQPEGVQREK
jgi:hypothetical protein